MPRRLVGNEGVHSLHFYQKLLQALSVDSEGRRVVQALRLNGAGQGLCCMALGVLLQMRLTSSDICCIGMVYRYGGLT